MDVRALPSWLSLTALGLAVLALLWLGAALARVFDGFKRSTRARDAIEGEVTAEQLLRDAGYRITGRQVRARWSVALDGRPVSVGLRADFTVECDGRTLVAEVKTGALVADVGHAATRRQLLEYSLAFGVSEVLLVDVLRGAVQRVTFPAVQWD